MFVVGGAFGFLQGFDGQDFFKNSFSIKEVRLSLSQQFDHPQFMAEKLAQFQDRMNEYVGESMSAVDLADIQSQVANWNWVSSVEVFRRWPDQITIEVSPKQVMAILIGKSGRIHPVLSDATIMEPIEKGSIPDVPVLSGEVFSKNREVLVRALVSLEQIPQEGLFSKKNIAEVIFHSKQGFQYRLLQPNLTVQLGEEKLGIKSARVSQVIEYLQNNKLQARVIDANLTKKVLVRLRKEI